MHRSPLSRLARRSVALLSATCVAASIAGLTPAAADEGTRPIDIPQTAAMAKEALHEALTATGATSITAGVTDLNGLLWQGTAGALDASGAAPTSTTRYGIGSTSKMFATAAVMQLVDAGKVGLDQPVVSYLPQFRMLSPQYRQITVRMLLDHSAGFPGSTYANGFTTAPYEGYADDVLANLARSRLKTTPGAMSVYCNDCFTVAGELVAQVSGQSFPDYVERNLLAPLGMTTSDYIVDAMPAAGSVARVVADGKTQPLEVTNVFASGGLMSTPDDVLAFARMLLNGGVYDGTRVLSAGSIATMGRSQLETTLAPVSRNVWNYGLGWDTVSDLTLQGVGQRAWVKGGDTADYHSGLVVAPDAGLAAFVAGAGTFNSGAAESLAEKLLLSTLAERGELASMPQPLGTDQPAPVAPTEDDINAMVGTFIGTPGLLHRIARGAGDSLTLARFNSGEWVTSPHALTFRADGAWWPDVPAAQAFRSVTGWGRTYLTVLMPSNYGTVMGEQVIGERVDVAGATDPAWRSRLGQWLFSGEDPTSTAWSTTVPATTISAIPGLPGYLDVAGLSTVDARQPRIGSMFLQVPLMMGRDLDDLVLVRPGLMRMGSSLLVERDRVPAVARGANPVAFDATGAAQWRAVPRLSVLAISGAQEWILYDADLKLLRRGPGDGAKVRAPKGSMLVLFGKPNTGALVTAARAT